MSYITKDQLSLYLQKVGSQATGPGSNNASNAGGTTRSRSTLTGPRPPTFKASSRRIFQDGASAVSSPRISSPITTSSTQLESAVRNLNMSSVPNTPNKPRPPEPILESMGEEAPVVMESMGSDDQEEPQQPQPHSLHIQHQQQPQHVQHANIVYGTVNGPPGFHGTTPQNWPKQGYVPNVYSEGPPSQMYSGHIGQDQYLHLQQQQQQQYQQYQQYQQQQQQQQQQQHECLRQQHAAQAAALGYVPSGAMPSPATASSHLQHAVIPSTPAQVPMTITPRIIPVMEIPKYKIINPSKTEIDDDDEDKGTAVLEEDDDDWAPEPPPRDPPKPSFQSQSSTSSIELPGPPVPPKIAIPSKPGSAVQKPNSLPPSRGASPYALTSTPPQYDTLSDSDRVPLPPPREFRRKTITPPSGATQTSSTPHSVTNGIFSVRSSPAPGTVKANSAKFNSLASAGGTGSSPTHGSVSFSSPWSPKVQSSTTSFNTANTTATATSNPWTSRKAVDHLRKNSISKGTGTSSSSGSGSGSTVLSTILPRTKAGDAQSPSVLDKNTRRSSMPVATAAPPSPPLPPLEIKELPPILGDTPLYDAEHDSKCIITEAEREEIDRDLVSIESRSSSMSLGDETLLEATEDIMAEQQQQHGVEEDMRAASPESRSSSPAKPPVSAEATDHKFGRAGSGTTLPSYICSSCDKPIVGTMITAMGKKWHSDHFVCTVCEMNLENVQFFHKDGLPYCSKDFHEKFSPKCGHCSMPIENCGDPFEEDGYMVHEDFPYCEKDYLRLFAPKCTGCLDPIQGDFINALKGKWHRDCFGCTVCHIGFDSTSYYVENGKPYCQAHYKKGSRIAQA
ncbi:hypothetical protein BGZ83_002307 [Gryganskiella cystojenkinii]|nr:hypothetical protein BGZ83_002307 [Gryganskiella cystojenkinii]